MLAGAPVFAAQLETHKMREALNKGDHDILQNMNLATRGTAGEFIKVLRQASPIAVLRMVNMDCCNAITRRLAVAADCLD